MIILEQAAATLAEEIQKIEGTRDVDDGFYPGKEQLDLKLKPEARSLGLTERSMARQLRSSLFGAEAVRQQRGRDEVRVYVRLPRAERQSEYDIEEIGHTARYVRRNCLQGKKKSSRSNLDNAGLR